MTQRIFDIENEQDMRDLWSILPNGIIKISPNNLAEETSLWSELNLFTLPIGLIKINWHDKTEITRPIQEATEQDIGKLCYFWGNDKNDYAYGILRSIETEKGETYYTIDDADGGLYFEHARRLTKQEVEEII